jgi:DnaJ like chaperone protein
MGVSNADGSISQSELSKIRQIALALEIRAVDLDSIKAMFVKSTGNAYRILEITTSATDTEVKKAYRTMAKKYHPDKLQSKEPALIKGAQEKFQEVQKAYEEIQKERGI